MVYVILGVIGYLLFILADLNKTKEIHPVFNFAAAVGLLLLIFSTIRIVQVFPASFRLPGIWPLICFIIASLCMGIQLYIIFFAVPFNKTYVEIGDYEIVDTGFFALARHPGVMWFFLFYLLLWLGTGKMMVLWANVVWTICDVIHVFLQDRLFFPRMFKDYDVYISRVPFMIPNRKSLNNFFKK
ncbi:MAG: hypothetical protein ABRQ24_07160 [Syntrophomonadaceae bacterium]